MSYRNVLLLIADDWSPIAGCYGNDVIKMPSVDALAARGTLFKHAFCTTPSCAASRANLLTGHYSHTHGQYGHSHSIHNFHTQLNMPSIPKTLQSAGFATGVVGKLHVQPESVYPWNYEAGGGRNVRGIADNISKFFETIDSDQPFYLHVGYSDPHRDFGNKQTYPGVPEVTYSPDEIIVPDFLPDHPDVRREFAEYYQSVSRLDTGIGMAVQALQDAGRADDTMIIVMSDHGMPFPGGKASSFDTGHHCPLIIARPNAEAVVSDALVNWNNIAPTVYEWCGVDSPEGLPEKSLVPSSTKHIPRDLTKPSFPTPSTKSPITTPTAFCAGANTNTSAISIPKSPPRCPVTCGPRPPGRPFAEKIWKWANAARKNFCTRTPKPSSTLKTIPWNPPTSSTTPAVQDIAEAMRQKVRTFRKETRDPWCLASYHAGEPGMEPGVT